MRTLAVAPEPFHPPCTLSTRYRKRFGELQQDALTKVFKGGLSEQEKYIFSDFVFSITIFVIAIYEFSDSRKTRVLIRTYHPRIGMRMDRDDRRVWNGQVFILNSNGAPFTFTRRPRLNGGGLVAPLSVSDADFMAGRNLR